MIGASAPRAADGTADDAVDAAASVVRIWAEAVGFEDIEPEDDFFSLGGDSVSAAQVARRVAKAVGIDVPPRTLFAHPTLREFTAFIDSGRRPAPLVEPRADRAVHPLAPGQERLFLHNRLHPDDAAYTVPTLIELAGDLDRDALSAALNALVARHEPLRTTFEECSDGVQARVAPPSPVPVEEVVVGEVAAGDEAAARETASAFLRRPFALAGEPPMRVLLIRLGPCRHWLVLAIHHIATDGDSERILLDELGTLYSSFAQSSSPSQLPDLPLSYGDLAVWRAKQASAVAADRLARRRAALDGVEDRPLALEGAAPDSGSGVGARHTRWLGPTLTADVRACAKARRTTVFVTLLAAFADLVSRWSDADDVCIGYPVSVREPEAARTLAGFFVDTRVLRADLRDRPGFHTLVERVHAEVGAADADSVPFDALAEAVAAARGHRGRLLRTWFNHLGAPALPPVMHGLTAAVLDVREPRALFDLNVYITEHDDDIRVEVVYEPCVCTDAAAAELADQYLGLIAHAVADPEASLRRHRRPGSRVAALPDPSDPLGTPAAPTLLRKLTGSARAHGQAPALRDVSGETGYADLRRRVLALRDALRSAGVVPGCTVAVRLGRGAALVESLLAVWAAGARLLMLDPAYPDARLSRYLSDSGASCLITADGVEAIPGVSAAEHDMSGGYLAFTSGTTGEPVGVAGGFEPIEHFLHWYSAAYGLGPQDRFALLAGLSHDPLFRDVLLPLWNGAVLCIPSPATFAAPADLLAWLRDERITVAHLTPPLVRVLMDEGVNLPSLRLVCLAGDAVRAEDVWRLAEFAPNALLLNGFGTTETPQLVSCQRLVPGDAPALGAGAPGSQLLVLDRDGELCDIGEAGEIVVRSRHLADEPGPGRALEDPVPGVRRFATGDRGRYRTDGTVEYLGRADDTVNIRGFRAHPAETDRALAADPRVRAAATVVRNGTDGPELVGYIVADGVAPAEIRARLARLLPAYLVPTVVVPVDRIPLTANGKVDRAALPDPRAAAPAAPAARAPEGAVEERLARIWSAVLGAETVDADASFFDQGGTSLQMLRLHAAIRREIDARVPLLALYESPSLRALARGLTSGSASAANFSAAPSARARGSRTDERSRRLAARRAGAARGGPTE